MTGNVGSIPGLGRSPGEGNGKLLQYSYLGNPMDRGAWWATVCGVTRVGHDLVTKPPCIYNTIFFLIHWSVDGHLGWFQVLSIMNHAAVNMRVKIAPWGYSLYFLCVYTYIYMYAHISPEGGLLDHVLVLFLFFWGTSTLFSIVAETIHTPTNSGEGFAFLHIHDYTYYL